MEKSITLRALKSKSNVKTRKLAQVIFNYLSILGVFILCSLASVNAGYIRTFGFGVYFGALWSGFEPLGTSIAYLIAGSVTNLNIYSVASTLVTCIFGLLYTYLYLRRGKKKKYIGIIFSVLSQCLYLYTVSVDLSGMLAGLLGVSLGAIVTFATMSALNSTIMHNFAKKLVVDEKVSLGVLIMILGMGLAALRIDFFEPIRLIEILLLIFLVDIGYSKHILFISICLGLGATLSTLDASYISAFALLGLICQIFVSSNRYLVGISAVLVDCFMGLLLNAYVDYNIVSLAVAVAGVLVMFCIPKKVIRKVTRYIPCDIVYDTGKDIVTRSQNMLSAKINNLSGIFREMERAYRSMTETVVSEADIKENIGHELMDKCCKNCANRDKCLKIGGKYSSEVFSDMLNAGLKKGKVNLVDVSQYLSSRCTKLHSVLSITNNMLDGYKNYTTYTSSMNSSRLLVADQLCGASSILADLSSQVKHTITYDRGKEERIKEEVGYIGVRVDDVAVYTDYDMPVVTISLKGEVTAENDKEINKIISRVCGIKMVRDDNFTPLGEIRCYTYRSRPNYSITYGCASCTKSHVIASGDTHTLIKIDDGKYMMALCDGMGSGRVAHSTSSLAISLIENFYKAGFSSDMILSSVNKLLSSSQDENYSTLDICVMDTRSSVMDFIKLGAPYGVIKNGSNIEVVDTSGLPIGVLDEMTPHIDRHPISDGDMIITFSDGICDVYSDMESLIEYIRAQDVLNPQTLAERILSHTIDQCADEVRDDMSVCVARLIANT